MCTSVVHSFNLIVTEEAKSHLLRSKDRRIAPAVTALYKRASQVVAQPMRLSLLRNPYSPLQLSPIPLLSQTTSLLPYTVKSSFLYRLKDTQTYTSKVRQTWMLP